MVAGSSWLVRCDSVRELNTARGQCAPQASEPLPREAMKTAEIQLPYRERADLGRVEIAISHETAFGLSCAL